MLSRSHRFLFVHIPKAAGNSIQAALRTYSEDQFVRVDAHHDGIERFQLRSPGFNLTKHSTLAEYRQEFGAELFDGLFKFACVRNPWDRAISHFLSPSRPDAVWRTEDFIGFLPEVKTVASYLSLPGKRVQKLKPAAHNVDYLMRFETLETDFQAVCGKLGIPTPPLPVHNQSTRASYRCYYDAETIDLVARRFREEIEFFGYSFE